MIALDERRSHIADTNVPINYLFTFWLPPLTKDGKYLRVIAYENPEQLYFEGEFLKDELPEMHTIFSWELMYDDEHLFIAIRQYKEKWRSRQFPIFAT